MAASPLHSVDLSSPQHRGSHNSPASLTATSAELSLGLAAATSQPPSSRTLPAPVVSSPRGAADVSAGAEERRRAGVGSSSSSWSGVRELKFLLLGDSNVGKSCVLLRYADNLFVSSAAHTIGLDFKSKELLLPRADGDDDDDDGDDDDEDDDGQARSRRVRMNLFDTAGTERFRTIMASLYRGVHCVLLFYDVTERSTFDSIPDWVRDIHEAAEPLCLFLVGNKSDLVEQKVVTRVEGERMAATLGMDGFFETSALLGSQVESLFLTAAECAARHEFWDQSEVSLSEYSGRHSARTRASTVVSLESIEERTCERVSCCKS